MVAGEWYKSFGGPGKTTYYHILSMEDEKSVTLELFDYYATFRKVVNAGKKAFPMKWWMEQLIDNAVHEIPKQAVPFLLTV